MFVMLLISAMTFCPDDTVKVWADDSRSQRVRIKKVDPEDVASPQSLNLSFSRSIGSITIGVKWAYERGVEYNEKMTELIEQIHRLCDKLNGARISLETYRREMRRLLTAIDRAHEFKTKFHAALTTQSADAVAKMNKALGESQDGREIRRAAANKALAVFQNSVERLQVASKQPTGLYVFPELAETRRETTPPASLMRTLEAIAESLEPKKRPVYEGRKILVYRDRSHTDRIEVPALNVDSIVDDVTESLSMQFKYDGPLFTQTVGEKTTWTLRQKKQYEESAKQLILKYRKLCMDYNNGLLCPDEYFDRLERLYAAELEAARFRQNFSDSLLARSREAVADMNRRLGGGDPGESALDSIVDQHRSKFKTEPKSSAVEQMSRSHRELVQDAASGFAKAVKAADVDLDTEMIEVPKSPNSKEKVLVPRLNTDEFVQNVEWTLSLHITYLDFGPEFTWARDQGLKYGESAQLFILRVKQLCMDYNAGLVSQEEYLKRSDEIEAALHAAGRLRYEMADFSRELKKGALAELDSVFGDR